VILTVDLDRLKPVSHRERKLGFVTLILATLPDSQSELGRDMDCVQGGLDLLKKLTRNGDARDMDIAPFFMPSIVTATRARV